MVSFSEEPIETQVGWLLHHVGVWCARDRVVVDVTGDDAGSWLQGQMTNDIGKLTPGRALYAFVLTVKGRILADVWVVQKQDGWSLLLPSASVEDALASMQRQIIMEDVTLTRQPEVQVWAAHGPKVSTWAARARESSGPMALHHTELLGHTGYVWLARTDDAAPQRSRRWVDVARDLGGGQVAPDAVRLNFLKLGIPTFGVDFGVEHHPQETGLAPWAVSFDKGCYFGQEVVCMIEARGKPPRRIVQLRADPVDVPLGETLVMPQPLYVDQDSTNADVGVLTQLVPDPENHEEWIGMGYVKRAVAEKGSLVRVGGASLRVERIVGERHE
jgi:folate-binding protein YgfZ